MEAFNGLLGVAAALPGANIDTDVIMPKQFLKGLDRSGLALGAFYDLRFDGEGLPRPNFVLNREPWAAAKFLIVGPNFGCGSSREHAVWGLQQLGIRAIIGTSFAGIFFDNCANNGLLALALPENDVETLASLADDPAVNCIDVNLVQQEISCAIGVIRFEIDKVRRERFLLGLDPVGVTLKDSQAISSFERAHFEAAPWLIPDGDRQM